MERLFTLLSKQISGLHNAAYLLATFALLSHLLALVRDRLLAHVFGASTTLDIYYAAFRIPDFLFVSLASMVSLFVLIPFIHDYEAQGRNLRVFVSRVFSSFFVVIVCVSIIVFFFVPDLVAWLFPGFTGDAQVLNELIILTRIMLLSPIVLGISNIFASITQAYKHFFVYAMSPVLYNVGIIVGILALVPSFGTVGLAWGVVFGALLHMGIQIPVVLRKGLMPRFTGYFDWGELKQIVTTSLPRTFTLATNQLVIIYLLSLASHMAEGSISVFTFGFNIQGVPLSIIGVSYSVAAFPTLAKLFSHGKHREFFDHMTVAIRHILFWAFPALVLFIVLRAQIVRVALGSGAFDWADTRLTAAVLALFVVSLVAQSLELLFIRGYYAAGRTRTPLIVKTLTSVLIAIMGFVSVTWFTHHATVRYFFESLLRISDVPGTTVIMLALAYSIGISISALILWWIFRHDFGNHLPRSLYRTLVHSGCSSIFGGVLAYGMLLVLGDIFNLDTFFGIFAQGALAGVIGIVGIIGMLVVLNNREIKEMWEALHHRFWKTRPVGVEQEEL